MTQAYTGVDYKNQPLRDAWWTRGWTSQNQSYIPVPPNSLSELGYPSGVTTTNVTANLFDIDGNPVSGFFTFWPSSPVTFLVSGQTTYMPQRFAGTSISTVGLNNMGNGKNYLVLGQLSTYLVSTDNPNMTPASFFYHVREHFFRGQEYDIAVPFAQLGIGPVDIHSLIMPPLDGVNVSQISDLSTEDVTVDVTMMANGLSSSPTSAPVQFAFVNTLNQPTESQWLTGQWASTAGPPYVAQILEGPSGTVNLAPGRYAVWVRITTATQIPVRNTGTLVIY